MSSKWREFKNQSYDDLAICRTLLAFLSYKLDLKEAYSVEQNLDYTLSIDYCSHCRTPCELCDCDRFRFHQADDDYADQLYDSWKDSKLDDEL